MGAETLSDVAGLQRRRLSDLLGDERPFEEKVAEAAEDLARAHRQRNNATESLSQLLKRGGINGLMSVEHLQLNMALREAEAALDGAIRRIVLCAGVAA